MFNFGDLLKGYFYPLSCLNTPLTQTFFVMAIDTASNTVQNPYEIIKNRWKNPYKTWKQETVQEAYIRGAEFDADLALLDYQNQYNSPEAKAARLRAAGINPDLVGIDGVSDSSGLSGVTGSMGAPDMSQDSAQFWLSNSQNILTSAMQFAQQMQAMRSSTLDNDIKNINYVKALQSLKDDTTSSSLFSSFHNPDTFADSSYFTSGISKRNQKRLRKLMPSSQAYSLYNTRINDFASSSMKAGESLALGTLRGNGGFDPREMAKGYKDVAEFLEKVQKYSASADAHQEKYRSDYYENSSGSLDASIDSQNNQVNRDVLKDNYESSKGNKTIDKFFSDLVTKLRNNNNWWSDALLMALYGMKSGAFNGAANFYGKVLPQQKSTPSSNR